MKEGIADRDNFSMAWTETTKKTDLMDLPGDIILDILKRLPVKTLCSLRCVSKILLNKLDDPLIFKLLTTTDAAAEIPLQLTSLTTRYRSTSALRGLRIEMQAMKYDGNALTAEENKHAPQNFACVKSFYDFDFCYYNLFFFSVASAEHPCFLSNPLRGEVLKLPVNEFLRENIVYRYGSYGMGFDTITNNHKIICVTSSVSEDDLEARVLVLGTSSWKEIPSLPPCYLGQDKICAHGDMHWLSDSERFCRQIISFDFTKEEFYLTPLPTSIPSDVLPYIHLLTWRGSIAIAYASYLDMSIKIWVLKKYETKEWASAPDHSISIGTYVATKRYGFWPRLFAHEWEHGIFFMDELGENMFFSDLRGGCNKFPTGSCSRKHAYVEIVGYAWSFMSLKHYGQLEVEDVAEVEKYLMLPSFLKQFGQCFIGVKKTESVKQRVWQLA